MGPGALRLRSNKNASPRPDKRPRLASADHRRLLDAARQRDTEEVRRLMLDHIDEAGGLAAELDAAVRQRFVSDADLQARILPRGRKA
ncbi:MAG: FCD domain-containing protein [Alphaproteobacteria bacterium]|nr:FCD domain-containing protein [Alphaproteobacteria bacterium]